MSKEPKLQFNVSDEAADKITALKIKAELELESQVMGNALRLYEFWLDNVVPGDVKLFKLVEGATSRDDACVVELKLKF